MGEEPLCPYGVRGPFKELSLIQELLLFIGVLEEAVAVGCLRSLGELLGLTLFLELLLQTNARDRLVQSSTIWIWHAVPLWRLRLKIDIPLLDLVVVDDDPDLVRRHIVLA